jgi:hypothetical protein
MEDMFEKAWGRLEVHRLYENGRMEPVIAGKNAITYRAKTLMSRIIGGGASGTFDFGTSADTLAVTGMAFGNGGHLIYNASTSDTGQTGNLPKAAGTGLLLNTGSIAANTSLPAMPYISGTDWGYDGVPNQQESGASYERVENGNIPWDGTVNIRDNNIGVTQPHTTLYSETYRLPLDSGDGIQFISETEVQFKVTLPQAYLNDTSTWGFAQQQANWVSEAGLIAGDIPGGAGSSPATQLYSTNGEEPASGNFADGLVAKDTTVGATGNTPATTWGSLPPDSFIPDAWDGSNTNTWNMVARKTFPVVVKSSAFSLVFVWTVGF